MAQTLKVNWSNVSDLSKNTLANSEEFEKARKNFLDILNSLPECWEGDDATTFIENSVSYVTSLEKDTVYFELLGKYFETSSEKYGTVVNENAERVEKINHSLDDDESKYRLVSGGA